MEVYIGVYKVIKQDDIFWVIVNCLLIDFNLALSVAKIYGLTEAQALEELQGIKDVVENNWRRLAGQYGLSRSEIEWKNLAYSWKS